MNKCMRGPSLPICGQHQRSTNAALLSRGSLPLYHAEHKPPALRSPPPTSSQSRWRAARMCPRMRAATARAVCCAAGCACAARCAASRQVKMSQPQPLPQPLEGRARRPCPAVVRQEQVCAVGWPCLARQRPQVADTHATTAAATGQVTNCE